MVSLYKVFLLDLHVGGCESANKGPYVREKVRRVRIEFVYVPALQCIPDLDWFQLLPFDLGASASKGPPVRVKVISVRVKVREGDPNFDPWL